MAGRTSEYQNDTNRRMDNLERKVDNLQQDISDIKVALARYTALYTLVALLLGGLLVYVLTRH